MISHPVKVYWCDAQSGGRASLPAVNQYITISRFPDDEDSWPDGAWSIVANFDSPPAEQGSPSVGRAHFLVEAAPSERLRPGAIFTPHEGLREVATVHVVSESQSSA